MRRLWCLKGRFFPKFNLHSSTPWSNMDPSRAVESLRRLSVSNPNLVTHSAGIASYVSKVSHLLTADESRDILTICSASNITIHTQGVFWLLGRASTGSTVNPKTACDAFVAAVWLGKRAAVPFDVEMPSALHSLATVSQLSHSDIFHLALAVVAQNGKALVVFDRLAFFTEKGVFSNSQIQTLLSSNVGTEVHDACLQIIYNRLSELSLEECIEFFNCAIRLHRPAPVTISGLLQVISDRNLLTASPDAIFGYLLSLTQILADKTFAWISSLFEAERARVIGLLSSEIDTFLEEIEVPRFCQLIRLLRPTTQHVFDALQLRAFILSDSMTSEQLSLVIEFISKTSQASLLVAYPALNKLKRRFFECHERDIVSWGQAKDPEISLLDRFLLSFVRFVRSIASFPLMPADSSAIVSIQSAWHSPDGLSPFSACSISTRNTICTEFERLRSQHPSFRSCLKCP